MEESDSVASEPLNEGEDDQTEDRESLIIVHFQSCIGFRLCVPGNPGGHGGRGMPGRLRAGSADV